MKDYGSFEKQVGKSEGPFVNNNTKRNNSTQLEVLLDAIRNNDLDGINASLKYVDVNARHPNTNITALHQAAIHSHNDVVKEVIEILIAAGADPELRWDGETPSECAKSNDRPDVAEWIEQAKLNKIRKKDQTVLNKSVKILNRKGLANLSSERLIVLLKLSDEVVAGTAVDDGGCGFDALAQCLGGSHTEKSLRLACHRYYLNLAGEENKKELDVWIEKLGANNPNVGSPSYLLVQYTGEELKDPTFSIKGNPTWFTQEIDGRILCYAMPDILLNGIHVIEITLSPESVGHYVITKEGYSQIEDEDKIKTLYALPTIVVSNRHFVPLLPREKVPVMQNYPLEIQKSQDYWILQSNPKNFKIDQYLVNKNEVGWLVKNDNMKMGDELFIWRSKGNKKNINHCGIIAHGNIIAEKEPQNIYKRYPELNPEDKQSLWKKYKSQGQHGIIIQLDFSLSNIPGDAVLPLSQLKGHQKGKVNDIALIKSNKNAASRSIFQIKEKQYTELLALWNKNLPKNRKRKQNEIPEEIANKRQKFEVEKQDGSFESQVGKESSQPPQKMEFHSFEHLLMTENQAIDVPIATNSYMQNFPDQETGTGDEDMASTDGSLEADKAVSAEAMSDIDEEILSPKKKHKPVKQQKQNLKTPEQKKKIGRLGEERALAYFFKKYNKKYDKEPEYKKNENGAKTGFTLKCLDKKGIEKEIEYFWMNAEYDTEAPIDVILETKRNGEAEPDRKYIEIKATEGTSISPATISRNQLKAMYKYRSKFTLFRVYDVKNKSPNNREKDQEIKDPYKKLLFAYQENLCDVFFMSKMPEELSDLPKESKNAHAFIFTEDKLIYVNKLKK